MQASVPRDDILTRVRKNRRAANQRAMVARRKCEQLQLEVAFLRVLNDFLLKQVRKLKAWLETMSGVDGMSENPFSIYRGARGQGSDGQPSRGRERGWRILGGR